MLDRYLIAGARVLIFLSYYYYFFFDRGYFLCVLFYCVDFCLFVLISCVDLWVGVFVFVRSISLFDCVCVCLLVSVCVCGFASIESTIAIQKKNNEYIQTNI